MSGGPVSTSSGSAERFITAGTGCGLSKIPYFTPAKSSTLSHTAGANGNIITGIICHRHNPHCVVGRGGY